MAREEIQEIFRGLSFKAPVVGLQIRDKFGDSREKFSRE